MGGRRKREIAGDPKHTTQEDPYLAASLKSRSNSKLEVTFPEDVSGINRVDITDVYPEGYLLTSLDDLKYRVIGEPAIVVDQTKVIFDRPTETLYTTNKAFIEEMAGRTLVIEFKMKANLSMAEYYATYPNGVAKNTAYVFINGNKSEETKKDSNPVHSKVVRGNIELLKTLGEDENGDILLNPSQEAIFQLWKVVGEIDDDTNNEANNPALKDIVIKDSILVNTASESS